jgi:hypothetical protein
MVSLLDLGPAECRFALTDDLPHDFCGKPTAPKGEPYCPRHKARCHVGRTSWEELARTIPSAEVPLVPASNNDARTLAVDEALARQGEAARRDATP